ncbi:MAG: hypothetical protein K2N01_08520 [Lachnospiraceae bacterium]|nr:hypothetical protein [Lachnospiraceae bacterium]
MSVKLKNISLVVMTAIFLCGFLLWSILKPTDAESVSERRPLAAFPAVSMESVLSGTFMTDFEKYTLDQFPLRDQFRTVKAVTACYILGQKDNNGIYVKDGFASKLEYPFNTDSIEYAASRFQFVYDRYMADKELKVYLSVIPDKNYFMAQKNGYPSMDYEKFVSDLREHTEFAEYIDITHLLELPDYYCTDTHWRQEKITDIAQHLAAGMGVSLSAEYNVNQVDTPFYGVYYGQSALPLAADNLYYLDNAVLKDCKVYDFETNAYIPVYDLEKINGNDSYEMFLSGSKSLLMIENPNATTDKELIIFRDSFGSSIAPLFAEGYEKIILVDIRYISPNMLDKFIEFTNQDVLFLYSTSVLNNSITIK